MHKLKQILRLLGSGSVLLLSSCSIYQSNSVTGGYTDSYQGSNVYVVSYKGNNYDDYDTVKRYTLKRAAHVTLNNHKQYFEIVATDDLSHKYQNYTPPTNASPSFYNENTSPPIIHTYSGNLVTHDKVALQMTIKLLDSPTARSYNAQALLNDLKRRD